MKQELVVNNIEDNVYTLKDNNNFYKIYMLFQINVNIGDIILINNKLLKEKNLYFGNLDEISGRKINNIDDEDLIVIKKEKDYYQKRLYG